MNRKIEIKYWWKCDKLKAITSPLSEALEESAMDRIVEMLKEGYSSGDLLDDVNIEIKGKKTPEDGWHCYGGFEVDTH